MVRNWKRFSGNWLLRFSNTNCFLVSKFSQVIYTHAYFNLKSALVVDRL